MHRRAAAHEPPSEPPHRQAARGDELVLSAMDRRIERRWITRSRVIGALAILLGAAVAVLGYLRYGIARTLTVSRDRVEISTVRLGEFREYIPVSGSVEPRETVYLDAADGGQVAQLMVEEGAFVKAGEALVRLNNTNLQLQVLDCEAQLAEQLDRLASTKLQFEQSRLTHAQALINAKYQASEAEKRLERLVALKGSGLVRRSDVEDAQLEFGRLHSLEEAQVQAATVDEELQREQINQLDRTVAGLNRNLAIARQNLDDLIIKAPFDGELTMLDAHLGESKLAGQRIGQVDRTDGFKVEALVDEHYLPRVAIAETATTDTDIDGKVHHLVVRKLYPQVTDRQFKVDLAFVGGAPPALRRGQTLQLRLDIGGERKGLVVANGPFYDDTGGQWVFVLPPGGNVAHRRAVQLGRRNLEQVEVLQGLVPGERVIVSSYDSFKDIDRVALSGGPHEFERQ